MRRVQFILSLIVFIAVCAIAGGSVLTFFNAYGEGDRAVLNWTSGLETGLFKYKIERSADNQNFSLIAAINPQGDYTMYEYIDDDLLKNSQRLYYYRIKMIFTDGSAVYSDTNSVTLQFSGIQETWGSIKAMFR
ncbi:hypothetical protein ISS30_08070 [bacterium]|nr:hypothetical protein [bacterium]